MPDDENRSPVRLGLFLTAAALAALVMFIVTGGDLGGTKSVESDADLPQVTSPTPPTPDSNTGRR